MQDVNKPIIGKLYGITFSPDVDDIIHYINAVNYATKLIKKLPQSWMKILEPLSDTQYGQKYIYADYYELFDEDFAKKPMT
jgi:hypothetical protein